MKTKMSRQTIYMLSTSSVLLIFVFVFSFVFLVPEGKNYRAHKSELKQKSAELKQVSMRYERKDAKLSALRKDNGRVLKAFDTPFDPLLFEKKYSEHFSSLHVSRAQRINDEDDFTLYEVNTTSRMNSPKSFYNFLDSINEGSWIIAVNFPIEFKRDGENIKSSFSMRVYNTPKEPK